MELTHSSGGYAYKDSGFGPQLKRHALEPLFVLIDGLAIFANGIGSRYIYQAFAFDASLPSMEIETYIAPSLLAAILFVSLSKATGNYGRFLFSPRPSHVVSSIIIWIGVACLLGLTAFLLKIGSHFSRGTLVIFLLFGGCGLILNRALWPHAVRLFADNNLLTMKRVLLVRVGASERSKPAQGLDAPDLQRSGFVLSLHMWVDFEAPLATRRAVQQIREMIGKGTIDEIFLELDQGLAHHLQGIAAELRLLPIPVRLVLDSATQSLLSRPLTQVGDMLVSEIQREPLNQMERAMKRLVDICVAAATLITLFPLMVLAAIAIKIETAGPVFFVQDRKGFSGKSFKIYKFRSMTVTENGSDIKQATKNDPRVTRVGRFIRKTSIDELPQLWNVLAGDMSIVGPRPHALAHDDYYGQQIAEYALRHHTKPGLTGLAQVKGLRGETAQLEDMRQRVESDIEYISKWSIWRDFVIMIRTVTVLLSQRNAL